MIRFFQQRWFLILLAVTLAIGFGGSSHLGPIADWKWLRDADVAAVLFLMALPLEASAIYRVIRRPLAPLLAVFVTFGLLPLIAWCVSFLLTGGQGPGLLIAAATPCTVASAAVWTRRAGGNDAVATMVTVVTNGLCFVVTPLWLWVFLGQGVQSDELEFKSAMWQLGRLVVAPMIVGQLFRLIPWVARVSTRHRTVLGILAQCGILYMVLVGSVQSGRQLDRTVSPNVLLPNVVLPTESPPTESRRTVVVPTDSRPTDAPPRSAGASIPTLTPKPTMVMAAAGQSPGLIDFLVMLAGVSFVHTAALWIGVQLSRWCGLSREDRIAVGFSGSQKTLMIGLKVALDYHISILPMVTFHVAQLLIDTLIADRMARRTAELARGAGERTEHDSRNVIDSPSRPS
jgi:sodium/bile acid cotransporter 7